VTALELVSSFGELHPQYASWSPAMEENLFQLGD